MVQRYPLDLLHNAVDHGSRWLFLYRQLRFNFHRTQLFFGTNDVQWHFVFDTKPQNRAKSIFAMAFKFLNRLPV